MKRLFLLLLLVIPVTAQTTINCAQNPVTVVAAGSPGTTYTFASSCEWRLTTPIIPHNGDTFVGATSCNPITSPGSCPSILSGAAIIGPSATFNSTYSVYQVTGQTQAGPQLTGACDTGYGACLYPEDLYWDGVPLQHLVCTNISTCTIGTGQWWFDYTNHIIYFHDNPSGHTVETGVTAGAGAFAGNANNVTIKYLTIEEFANSYTGGTATGAIGVNHGANALTEGTNWIVEYNEIMLNHTNGVQNMYEEQTLNNNIHNNGVIGIGGGIGTTAAPTTQSTNSGIQIQGNNISYNNYAHFNSGVGAGGIKWGATTGITVQNNTITYNEGCGIHSDSNSGASLIQNNIIEYNYDGCGFESEIAVGITPTIVRNNVVLENGVPTYENNANAEIWSQDSPEVIAYCNNIEVPNAPAIDGWIEGASDRGYNSYSPGQYLTTTGNWFHHNNVIIDAGATGVAAWVAQSDVTNQPNFFSLNTPPDYNMYHIPIASATDFIYANESTNPWTAGSRESFTNFQSGGADVHGTVDTINTSGFPTVQITSPADQSSVISSTITATASDTSGISSVNFYIGSGPFGAWSLVSTVTTPPYTYSWVPATQGQYTVAAMAVANSTIQACYAITLFATPGLIITSNPGLPSGIQNRYYTQNLIATGGTPPYTWSLTSGSLPSGLSLSGNTLSGIFSASATTETFTLTVTDSATPTANTSSQQFNLTVYSSSLNPASFVGIFSGVKLQ